MAAAVNDRAAMLLRFLGVVALILVIVVGVMIGTQMRQSSRRGEQTGERTAHRAGLTVGSIDYWSDRGTGSADRSLPTS